MTLYYRTPFAPEFNFVVKYPFTFKGRDYAAGDDFDKADADQRQLQSLYDANKVDAVIPTIVIMGEQSGRPTEAVPQPAKGKPGRKPKAVVEEAPEPAVAPGNRYRLESNFGTVRIMDGDVLVRECDDLEAAKAAMAELAGE